MLESFEVQTLRNGFVLTVYRYEENQGNNRTVWLERGKLLAEINRMLEEIEGNMEHTV